MLEFRELWPKSAAETHRGEAVARQGELRRVPSQRMSGRLRGARTELGAQSPRDQIPDAQPAVVRQRDQRRGRGTGPERGASGDCRLLGGVRHAGGLGIWGALRRRSLVAERVRHALAQVMSRPASARLGKG